MTTPGADHLLVPTDPRENVRFRLMVYRRARTDPVFREGLLRLCAGDIEFWVNLFAWQFNPLKDNAEYGPFIFRPHQAKAIRRLLKCHKEKDDAAVEKSREEGGTYALLLLLLWVGLFQRHKKFLVVSRNEKAVNDRNDPMSVFWKIDTVLRFLPDWMKGEIRVTKTGYRFRRTGSYITGTASTEDVGVGDRAAIVLLDEFGKVKNGAAMRQAVSNTTDCAIYVSTHEGIDTEFFNLCQSPRIVKIQLHWTMNAEKTRGLYEYDPLRPSVPIVHDKNYPFPPDYPFVLDGTPTGGPRPGVRSPWYDKKCAKIGSAQGVAMDLDINPSGSSAQFFDPIVIRRLVETKARPPLWVGDLRHDRDSAEPHGLSEGGDGIVRLWVRPDITGRVPVAPYAAAVDVGEGTGATPSCLTVMDCRTGEKVCEVETNRTKVEPFAVLSVALCRFFADAEGRPAKLCWEKQGSTGIRFKDQVFDLGFRNIHYHVHNEGGSPVYSDTPGFLTTPKSKGWLLKLYRSALADGRCVNPSERALRATLGFTNSGRDEPEHPNDGKGDRYTRLGGANVEHGDLVIADALCWMLVDLAGLQVEARSLRKRRDADEAPYGSFLWRRQLRERDALASGEEVGPYYVE